MRAIKADKPHVDQATVLPLSQTPTAKPPPAVATENGFEWSEILIPLGNELV